MMAFELTPPETITRAEAARRAAASRRANCEARLAALIRACLEAGVDPAPAEQCHRCAAALRADRSIRRGLGYVCHHRFRAALDAAQLELF
jgi:hypothetical protein